MKHRPTTPKLLRTATAVGLVVALVLVATVSGATAGVATVQTDDTTPPPAGTADEQPGETSGEPPAPELSPFAVQPSSADDVAGRDHFVYTLSAGEVWGDTVTLSNLSDEQATYVIYTSDAYTTRDGGYTLLKEEEQPVDVGTWIELGTSQFTLEPGTQVDIPFRLEVPAEATPGDHSGAIVAQQIPSGDEDEDEDQDQDPGTTLEVRLRIGARVYVRVNGPLEPALRIDDIKVQHQRPKNPFDDGTMGVRYVVTNTGNIRLTESIEVKVKGLFGRTLQTRPAQEFVDVLPGGSIELTAVFDALSAWEPLSVEVTASSREVTVSRTKTFYPIPWPSVIVIAIVVVGLAIWWWLRRRTRRADERGDDPTRDDPDEPADPDTELVEAGQ